MKKTILIFILKILLVQLSLAQVETYSNYRFNGKSYNAFVIRADSETLKKFDILENKKLRAHDDLVQTLIKDPYFFLINACIFDSTCNPLGYYVKDSHLRQKVNLSNGYGNFYLKPNGLFIITDDNAIICESSIPIGALNVRLGIQSGPMLIKDGLINSQFNPNSGNNNLRAGVGIFQNQKGLNFIVFCISNEPVNFYDFASFLKEKFNCENALCLESAGCAMYFPNQAKNGMSFNGVICSYIYFKL